MDVIGRWLINLALLGLCVLLLVLARWPSAPPPGLAQLAGLAPEAVTRISLEQQGRPTWAFHASPDGWRQTQPRQEPLSTTVKTRLDALVRAPARRAFTLAADDEARAQQLTDLGLAAPWLELAFNHQRLSAGAAEPIGRQRYLRVGDQILLLDDRWLLPLLALP